MYEKPRKKRSEPLRPDETPYEILGVPETADSNEIRRAYLQNVRLSPPEKDPESFDRIRKAYGRLIDAEKKRELDLSLFKAESQLAVDDGNEYSFATIIQRRLIRLLLSSSDLYVKNFSRHYESIEERIDQLQ